MHLQPGTEQNDHYYYGIMSFEITAKVKIKLWYARATMISLSLLAFYLLFKQLQLQLHVDDLGNLPLGTTGISDTNDFSATMMNSGGIAVARPTTSKPKLSSNSNDSSVDYTTDELCGKCRAIPVNNNNHNHKRKAQQTCGSLIYRTAAERNISLADAARIEVEQSNHRECQLCLPESCPESAKRLWRYDQRMPPIHTARTHYLSSIPSEHRIPKEQLHFTRFDNDQSFEVLDAFFSKPDNSHPKRQYLFEYNPSLVAIPKDQIPTIDKENPVYLASYRVSTQQGCFPTNTTLTMLGGSWRGKPVQYDYLGLALLRSDLSIIQDVVLELPKSHFGRREDFRLFALHGQIYVASFCQIVPIWINGIHAPQSKQVVKTIKQVFPSPLTIIMRKNPSFCSREREDIVFAKSLNYFVDQDNKTLVEMQPAVPHIVNKIDLSNTAKDDAPSRANPFRESYNSDPSFFTREQLDLANNRHYYGQYGLPFSLERGGACCIPFKDPSDQSRDLLLGVAHVKTMLGSNMPLDVVKGNHYLSLFYAIEAAAPYSVVARSGLFCLPAHPRAVSTLSENPLADLPIYNPLDVAGTTYGICPAIHFVNGMTEKADDPSKLIMAYGMSDCTPWFVELNKTEVIGMLFPPM